MEYVFNLNNEIRVKLEDKGFVHWMDKHNEIYDKMDEHFPGSDISKEGRKGLEYFKSKVDSEGYVKMQAWEFMQIFGNSIVFGTLPIFKPDVLIDAAHLSKRNQ